MTGARQEHYTGSAGGSGAAAVSSFYALDPDAVLEAVEQAGYRPSGHLLALNSYENRVYRVGLEDDAPLVVKFYRPDRWSDAAVLEEHAFTAELAAAEIPVIAPLADARGRTLRLAAAYRFALYPCVGGRAPELDDFDHLEELGRLLGRVHGAGAVRRYRHRPQLTVERLGADTVRWLLAPGVLPPTLAESYRNAAGAVLERVQRRFATAGAARALRLHGDCHPGNILVRNGVMQLLDFDDTMSGPAVQDLWMFLSGDRDYMQAGLACLLRGYRRFQDFDSRELVLIEALRALRMIHYAGWLARRWADPAFPRAFPWFGSERYWGEHILALQEQAAVLDEAPIAEP